MNIQEQIKKDLNILSLFDGMSCGQIALNRLGICYKTYYASEIDKHAIKIAKKNYPNTKHIGSVTEVDSSTLGQIDLLIGGSPCQGFSMAGKKKGSSTIDGIDVITLEQYLKLKEEGFEFDGQSFLFWEFVRLLKETSPTYFLLENVVMKKEWEDMISEVIGTKPIEINSNLVSCQNRRRLYWTNIPDIILPQDKGIFIKDIIYDNNYKVFTDLRITKTKSKTKNYVKWDLSGKGYGSQQDRAYYIDGRLCTLPKANPGNKLNIVLDYENDIYRRLHPVEAERAQTVPDYYTEGVLDNKRLEMLGNGWTVDIIVHIFKNMKF